jgi:hypothetical protein
MIRKESEADDPPPIPPEGTEGHEDQGGCKTRMKIIEGAIHRQSHSHDYRSHLPHSDATATSSRDHSKRCPTSARSQAPPTPRYGRLQQVPAVFPVFVPIPAWLWSDGARREDGAAGPGELKGQAPQLKSIWEKLVLTSGMASLNANARRRLPHTKRERRPAMNKMQRLRTPELTPRPGSGWITGWHPSLLGGGRCIIQTALLLRKRR